MQRKLDRAIAALEVEAKMLEAHAEKLSIMTRHLADPEHQREIIKLSHEETEKAEGIRWQIRLRKDQRTTSKTASPATANQDQRDRQEVREANLNPSLVRAGGGSLSPASAGWKTLSAARAR